MNEWMNEWTLFIVDDVGSGRPVSRARGSCIKHSTKGKIKIKTSDSKVLWENTIE